MSLSEILLNQEIEKNERLQKALKVIASSASWIVVRQYFLQKILSDVADVRQKVFDEELDPAIEFVARGIAAKALTRILMTLDNKSGGVAETKTSFE